MADERLLGARDGLVSGMLLIVRREIGQIKSRLSSMPTRWTRQRAPLLEQLERLTRMDRELDTSRRKCVDAWREQQAVEIISPLRPEPVNPIT